LSRCSGSGRPVLTPRSNPALRDALEVCTHCLMACLQCLETKNWKHVQFGTMLRFRSPNYRKESFQTTNCRLGKKRQNVERSQCRSNIFSIL
jgi:hypothetical protein